MEKKYIKEKEKYLFVKDAKGNFLQKGLFGTIYTLCILKKVA